MFNSQALETAIGLALMFFIVATAASMVVEVISRLLKKRAKDLENAIRGMLGNLPDEKTASGSTKDSLNLLKDTSVYQALASASAAGRKKADKLRLPSYISARSFADAAVELLTTQDSKGKPTLIALDKLPENLRKRLTSLVREGNDELTKVKSGLERWFDDTMSRTEGAYKRWSTAVLFAVGIILAGVLNASTVDTAQDLWADSVTRQAVVDAADKAVSDQTQDLDLGSVEDAASELDAAKLPVGWDEESRDAFFLHPDFWSWGWWGTTIGFLLTGLLVMMGAPFWFDLLGKLVSLRSTGLKPAAASADPASATGQQIAVPPAASAPPQPMTDDEIQQNLAKMLAAEKPSATP